MLSYLTTATIDQLQDRALRTATMTPNRDPLDVMCERETAVERLEEYLRHVALSRAVNMVESAFRMENVRRQRVS